MPRLAKVVIGRTNHTVGFVIHEYINIIIIAEVTFSGDIIKGIILLVSASLLEQMRTTIHPTFHIKYDISKQ